MTCAKCMHVFVLSCMIVCVRQASAVSYENKTLLKTTLLSGYDSDMRPLNNQTEAINVTVGMTLFKILDVDTIKGVLSTILVLDGYWRDEKITWSPSDYGGVTSLMIQQNYVWTPPLTLGQPVEFSVIGDKWMHVQYQPDGRAYWRPGGSIETTCPVDMKYWPFDKQTCEISFFPYDYWQGEVEISTSQLNTDSFNENSEWVLDTAEASTRNIYGIPEALFTLTLKRRSVFYILTMIIPLFGLGILAGCVFLLPSDSGERVSYAITILLALTVFLTILSDNMPKVSNPVPLLCIFLLLGIVISGLTTIVVILNLAVYHRSPDTPVGPWYAALVRKFSCRSNHVHDDERIRKRLNHINKGPNAKLDTRLTITSIASKEVGQDSKPHSFKPDAITGSDAAVKVTWKEVSYAIDVVMFVVVTVVQVVPSLILFIVFLSL